jgi:Zn-dependent protease with chaperone function
MTRTSLLRVLGVLAMSVGFYALALSIVGALCWLPWAQAHYEHHLGPAGILCGVLGAWLLFALLPRPTKFIPPGLPLDRDEHPRLQKLVHELAHKTGERTPDEIYIVPEATAFTYMQRRWLGLKKVRAIGLGLPLLATLSEQELSAVIVHEFGHHRGGELRVVPWLVGARRALGRTLENLNDSVLWLHWPFIWYARWFMRVTFKISREQEFAADALAARVVGAQHVMSALERICEVEFQWSHFWAGEALPMLKCGYRPPLLDGFRMFQSVVDHWPSTLEAARKALNRETSDQDTHPSLNDRLAALTAYGSAADIGDRPAWELLDHGRDIEHGTLIAVCEPDALATLKPLAWENAAHELWLPRWRETLAPYQAAFANLSLDSVPDVLRDRAQWTQRLRRGLAVLSPEAESKRLTSLLGMWFGLELIDAHGFDIESLPGRPLRVLRGTLSCTPHELMSKLADGTESTESFRALCADIRAGSG